MRPTALLLLLALLVPAPARAQDDAPPAGESAAPADAPAPATGEAAEPEKGPVDAATGLRLHEKALELIRRADGVTYRPQDMGLKSLEARLVMPGTPIGAVSADIAWTAGAEGGTDARIAVVLDEKVPKVMRNRFLPALRSAAESVLPPRFMEQLTQAHLDWLNSGGRGAVVAEYTEDRQKGVTQTLRFDPDTGVPTEQSMELATGDRVVSTQRYEPEGDRHRIVESTTRRTGPDGRVRELSVAMEWFSCGDVRLPWRFVSRSPFGETTFYLEAVVVNGTGFSTPREKEAAASAGDDGDGNPPADADRDE